MFRRTNDPKELFAAACSGDRASLARLLSLIERGGDDAREIGRLSYPLIGNGYSVGITGAPGAGKSTLTSALIAHLRDIGDTGEVRAGNVAVLAIDPSSPFTGGAILGDRVRMQDHATDEGVFIRSMATRGHLGGLSLAASEAMRLLDAVKYPWILVETVGVGQVEVEIAGKADTTIVVVNPGWGDAVQANKADRKGVEETRRDLEQMLELSDLAAGAWRPPIMSTVGTTGEGVEAMWSAVLQHRSFMESSGDLAARRSHRLRQEMRAIIERRLEHRAREICTGPRWDSLEAQVLAHSIDPWSAADQMLEGIGA
ncbi:MAG: methylmalonyl Co-A mutase-associated GTPase MeaB [Ilumatobacteraceae bacterium]